MEIAFPLDEPRKKHTYFFWRAVKLRFTACASVHKFFDNTWEEA